MAGFVYFSNSPGQDDAPLDRASAWLSPAGHGGELRTGMWHGPLGAIVWKCGVHAPFDQFECEDGCALVWGEALAEDTDACLDARTVYQSMCGGEKQRAITRLARFSGLFAWAYFEKEGQVWVGGDILGLFPIHYFKNGGHFGFSTNLRALSCHPAYDRTIDAVGLMRHLIENGGVGERTLQRSGKRLPICSALGYDSKSGHLEVCAADLPRLPTHKIEDAEEGIALAVDATRRSVHRLLKRKPDLLLLSGGLDSRHVLALANEIGVRPVCVTAGRVSDFESVFASEVARQLKLDWHHFDDRVDTLEEDVRNELRLGALSGGFSTWTMNGLARLPGSFGHRWFGGVVFDGHFMPTDADFSITELQSFEHLFGQWINSFGVAVPILERLCRNAEQREALAEALREIRDEWEHSPFSGHDRLWWSLMRGRVRPHLGGHIWKGTFRSWPVLPGLDLPMMESLRSLAPELFLGRQTQRGAFARISPKLAKIPLDSLSDSPRAIHPSLLWKFKLRGIRKAKRKMSPLERAERHRYIRCLNLDFPAWREIRRLAEPHRDGLREMFEPGVVDEILLPPDAEYTAPSSIVAQQGGLRLLYGLMLWLADEGY